MTYAKTLKDISCWLERNKQFHLTQDDIVKEKGYTAKQVAVTVDETSKPKCDSPKFNLPKNKAKSDFKGKSKKNIHHGLTC